MTGITCLNLGVHAGGVALPVILGGNFSEVNVGPTDSYTGYRLTSGGAEDGQESSVDSFNISVGTWLPAGASGSDYDVRATLDAGTLNVGTTGSWLNLGTTRVWQCFVTDNGGGSSSANLTIDIRTAGGGSTLATATVQLAAEVL